MSASSRTGRPARSGDARASFADCGRCRATERPFMAQRLRAEGRRATLVVLSDIQGSGGDVHHSHSATFKNHNHKDQWIDVPLPLTSSLARSDSVDGLGQSIDVGCEGPVLSQNWIESTGSIRRYTARFDVTLFVVDDRLAAGVERLDRHPARRSAVSVETAWPAWSSPGRAATMKEMAQ